MGAPATGTAAGCPRAWLPPWRPRCVSGVLSFVSEARLWLLVRAPRSSTPGIGPGCRGPARQLWGPSRSQLSAACPKSLFRVFPRGGPAMWHAGHSRRCREGGRRSRRPGPSRGCPARQPRRGAGPASRGPGRGVVWRWPSWAVRRSLVEEVGLEGGGQRQRVDLAQPLLPQGQAHGTAAEVHERQGLGCGHGGGREREREPG